MMRWCTSSFVKIWKMQTKAMNAIFNLYAWYICLFSLKSFHLRRKSMKFFFLMETDFCKLHDLNESMMHIRYSVSNEYFNKMKSINITSIYVIFIKCAVGNFVFVFKGRFLRILQFATTTKCGHLTTHAKWCLIMFRFKY